MYRVFGEQIGVRNDTIQTQQQLVSQAETINLNMSLQSQVANPDKGVKVDAALIAQPFREEIKQKVKEWKKQGIGTYSE